MVAAHRGLSQLKHVLHRLLAPRHSPCALSNLFLDPIVSPVQRTKTDETDLEAVFTKVFARLNPAKFGQSSINKIADCSTQYTDIKEQEIPKKRPTTSLNLLENGGSDRTRTCDPRLIKAVL